MSQLTQDADVEKHASAATLSELEDTIRQLKWELEKMKGSLKKKEETIGNDNSKIEQLQLSLTLTQRELDNALVETERDKYTLVVKDEQIQDLESKKKSLSGEISQLQSILAEKDEFIQKLEVNVKVKAADHELKMKNSEQEFDRLKTEARERHRKDVKALQTKLKDDQIKHMAQLNIYQKRVDHLEAEIGVVKFQNEKELKLLDSLIKNHEDEFKKLFSSYDKKLEDSEKKYQELEDSMATLNESMRFLESVKNTEIGSLQQSIAHAMLAQKQLEADAEASYTTKLEKLELEWKRKVEQEKECAEVAIQKLNEMHATAIEVALYNHQVEFERLKKDHEEEKPRLIQATREDSLNEIERLHNEIKNAEEKWEVEREELRSVAAQQQSALVMAHQHALESQMKKAEVEMIQLKENHARDMCIAVSRSTEKAVMESLTLHEDHKKRLDRLAESHKGDLERLRNIHLKEIEKHKANTTQALNRVAELEYLIQLKDKKLKEAADATGELETEKEACVKELKFNHEKAFNFQRSKFCKDKEILAKTLEKKYRAELDNCNAFHSRQYQTLQTDLNRSKMLMRQKQTEIANLQMELVSMKERVENRESRPDDIQRISELEQQCVALRQTCDEKDAAFAQLEGETRQLRMEMHNREENYNRIFRSSPVVQPPTSGELKSRSPSRSAQGSRSESRQSIRINFP